MSVSFARFVRMIVVGIGVSIATMAATLLVSAPASAVDPYGAACNGGGGNSAICQGKGNGADPIAGPSGAIVSVTTILAIVAGIVSVIFIIIGGLKYVTSGGDSSSIASAKSTIIAALIGLVIAALARPIVTFVIGKL